jgi:hypothetical protein
LADLSLFSGIGLLIFAEYFRTERFWPYEKFNYRLFHPRIAQFWMTPATSPPIPCGSPTTAGW